MLRFDEHQLHLLGEVAFQQFEAALLVHVSNFAPDLFKTIGSGPMADAIRVTLRRATAYGFTRCGPLRLYVELALLFGSRFDTDPQYRPIRTILMSGADEMARARSLHDHVGGALEAVVGPDGRNVWQSLRFLRALADDPDHFTDIGIEAQLQRDMRAGFPQKAEYVGPANLSSLIRSGLARAAAHDFRDARSRAMMPTLMYAFGHGCFDDPLYPWIGRTLSDPRITSAERRARRLERKSLTWLDHVLSRETDDKASPHDAS